jgi:hypothetical protein
MNDYRYNEYEQSFYRQLRSIKFAVIMKNEVSFVVTPYSSEKARRLKAIYRLHLQGKNESRATK